MIEKMVRDDMTETRALQIDGVPERSSTDEEPGSAVYLNNVIPAVMARLANVETPVTILSPYLTADVAQQLLTGKNAEHCEIYTLFSAELFAYGSSSLDTLDVLSRMAYRLFHLPNLHAKIVLVHDAFASIGSQNLTRLGLARREASVIIVDSNQIERIQEQVAEWAKSRRPITAEMIEDMKRLLPEARKYFEAGQRAATEVDNLIWNNEQERGRQRQNRLKEKIKALAKAQSQVHAVVRMQEKGNWPYSLVRTNSSSLIHWRIGHEDISLQWLKWYPCIIESTGKVAWVRVAKTRITYVTDEKRAHTKLGATDSHCWIRFAAEWDTEVLHARNLRISIECPGVPGHLNGSAWFAIDSIQFSEFLPSSHHHDQSGSRLDELRLWIEQNRAEVESRLVTAILEPWWPIGWMSRARESDKFFGSYGTRHTIRLGQFRTFPILIAQ